MNTKHVILLISSLIFAAEHSCTYAYKKSKQAPVQELSHLRKTQVSESQTITICSPQQQNNTSWSSTISHSIETSNSLWLQLLLVFFLGLLMSLTPCIYPMIPITVGILQAQGSSSLVRNFLLALTYTLGMATTFAILGLFAAVSGQLFGTVLVNPYVVLPVVALLAYLGGSMLGLYEMYVPRWMQPSTTRHVKRGSFISTFLFGVASGTVASPCLSPGLIFLLSIVTVMANKLLGFIMLFVFGIGLSVPLLFIGSFSGSLNLLPRSGMWMVEVKRFFGLMLIGMCFYFLANIMPWFALLALASVTSLLLGLFYLYITTKYDTFFWKTTKSIMGLGLIVIAIIFSAQAYTAWNTAPNNQLASCWVTNYQAALDTAKNNKKYLFIDVGAPCCSLCHAIDAKLFTDTDVLHALNSCILLKIDGSDTTNTSTISVLNNYQVIGFPTILLINPTTKKCIKQWGGELYTTTKEDFITELQILQSR